MVYGFVTINGLLTGLPHHVAAVGWKYNWRPAVKYSGATGQETNTLYDNVYLFKVGWSTGRRPKPVALFNSGIAQATSIVYT